MPRTKESNPEPIAEESSETYYKAKKILGEKKVRGNIQYLVDWEGLDPDTGRPYDPTWEPEDYITFDLVEEWKQREATRNDNKRKRNETESSVVVSSTEVADRPRKKLKRGRRNPTPEPESIPEAESVPEPESSPVRRSTSRRLRQIYDPEDDTSAVEVNQSTVPAVTSTKQLRLVLPVTVTSDASDHSSSSSKSPTTQVFVPDVDNEVGDVSEVSVVIPPVNEFVNLKHLAKRVIPDSQSFNDSTSTESQKPLSAPVPISSSLPQPTQDEAQAPPSSFVQESDPLAVTVASQLIQVDLPASSAFQKDDPKETTTQHSAPITETSHSSPHSQLQPQAAQPKHSPKETHPAPSRSQEEFLSTQSGDSQVIQSADSEKQQAIDSGSEESQDITTAESGRLRQGRRESNDLFHSDRPPSPALPVVLGKQIITSQDSTQSREGIPEVQGITTTTTLEQLPQASTDLAKQAEVGSSVLNINTIKPFDSQETLSQIISQPKETEKPASRVQLPAEHNTIRALPHTVHATPKATPSVTKQIKPTTQSSQPQHPTQSQGPVTEETISSHHTARAPVLPPSAFTGSEHRVSPRRALWTTYRQSQSADQQASFTPIPFSQSNLNMSNIEMSSSIPAAPSQMPDTLISQTLPPRPTTPSSYTSSVPRDATTTFQAPSRASSQALSQALSQAQSARNTPSLSFKERRALALQLAQKAHAEEQARLASQSIPAFGQDVKISAAVSSDRPAELPAAPLGHIDLTTSTAMTTPHNAAETAERILGPIEHVNQAGLNNPSTVSSGVPAAVLPARQALDLYIPIALPTALSKLYASIFDRQGGLIEAFVNDKLISRAMSKKIEDVVEQANAACFHSDAIGDGPLTQMELDSYTQLTWDVQQSPKLAVLDSLLEAARHMEKHIVFIVESGRIVTLLQRFLRASRINYSCPEEHIVDNARTPLTVTILTSDGGSHIVSRADLIIGLDKTFDVKSFQVTHVRKQLNNDLCPTVTLLVPFTVEHLTRALRKSLTGDEYLRSLVSGAAHLRKQVGDLQFDSALLKDVGKQLASLLTGSRTVSTSVSSATDIPFPNIDLSPLRDFGSPDQESQAIVSKRPLDDSLAEEQPAAKKTRFEEAVASKDSPFPASISRIADSTAQPATSTKADTLNGTVAKDLRVELANVLTALGNQEAAFSTLETQFQQQQTELLITQQELARVTIALATSETKRTSLVTTLNETRQERNTLRKDLDIANKTLVESAVPDVAIYGATRLQAAKVEPLETRLVSLQRDFDFTRQQYQNASDSASALSNELDEVKAQNEALTAKASGSTIQLREMFEARSVERANDETDMLRQQLSQRDRRIEQLEKDKEEMIKREELRGMARVTRSRSPATKNTLAVPGIQGHHVTGSSGTASALARSAAAMVRAVSGRSPAGSRVGSRQSSPLKDVK